MSVVHLTRVERAEDILNCQGVSFEAWLAQVEAAAGIDCHADGLDWAAWEHGVSAADHALLVLSKPFSIQGDIMTAEVVSGRFEYHRPTALPPEPPAAFTKTFEGKSGIDFSPINEAQGYLAARGFSFGPSCVSSRIGVMFGRDWRIAKWRNLTPLEQHQCHGVIEGDRRLGPVTFRLFFNAPGFAFAALGTPEQADAIVKAWSDQR